MPVRTLAFKALRIFIFGSNAKDVTTDVGQRLTLQMNDCRESKFLPQCIGLAMYCIAKLLVFAHIEDGM